MKVAKSLILSLVVPTSLIFADDFWDKEPIQEESSEDRSKFSYDCVDCKDVAKYVDNYISDWNSPEEADFWGTYPTDYERDTDFDTIDFFRSSTTCSDCG